MCGGGSVWERRGMLGGLKKKRKGNRIAYHKMCVVNAAMRWILDCVCGGGGGFFVEMLYGEIK